MYNNKLSALVVATLALCSAGAHADTIISKDSTGSVINSQLTIAGHQQTHHGQWADGAVRERKHERRQSRPG
ncbi:MAG: hypothetical protein IT506_09140 [Aquabacterium sp.]|nr:hypothetical protein [Aquabacterium sp.]